LGSTPGRCNSAFARSFIDEFGPSVAQAPLPDASQGRGPWSPRPRATRGNGGLGFLELRGLWTPAHEPPLASCVTARGLHARRANSSLIRVCVWRFSYHPTASSSACPSDRSRRPQEALSTASRAAMDPTCPWPLCVKPPFALPGF